MNINECQETIEQRLLDRDDLTQVLTSLKKVVREHAPRGARNASIRDPREETDRSDAAQQQSAKKTASVAQSATAIAITITTTKCNRTTDANTYILRFKVLQLPSQQQDAKDSDSEVQNTVGSVEEILQMAQGGLQENIFYPLEISQLRRANICIDFHRFWKWVS